MIIFKSKTSEIENVYNSVAVFDAAVIILRQRQHMYVLHNLFKMKGKLGSF